MVECGGLLNRCTGKTVPRVRIPPAPVYLIDNNLGMKIVVVGKRVGKCFRRPLCFLVLSAFFALPSLAQDAPTKTPKVRHSRLSLDDEGLTCVVTQLKNNIRMSDPFTGVAFWDESWGRAEVTYKDGILDGPVVVVVNNKILSQFRYDKGRKVLE